MITFDPVNKRIILDTSSVDVQEIYSRWKEWVQGGNAEYLPAFSTVGGDPLGSGLYIASYFFLENGWRIRPMEADHTLTINGNISVRGGGIPVVPTLGTYKVVVQYIIPVQAQAIATSGGGAIDPQEIAAAVLDALMATTIPVNVSKVKGQVVIGTGTETDPWGPQ